MLSIWSLRVKIFYYLVLLITSYLTQYYFKYFSLSLNILIKSLNEIICKPNNDGKNLSWKFYQTKTSIS